MTKLRLAAFAAVVLAGLVAPGANAADRADFTTAAFDSARKAGKPILVEIWASWCPTCQAQQPTITKLIADPAYKDLVILEVDFDAQKDIVRSFKVRQQSTLIAFHGETERARSVGETDQTKIVSLVDKAMN